MSGTFGPLGCWSTFQMNEVGCRPALASALTAHHCRELFGTSDLAALAVIDQDPNLGLST